MVSMNLLSEGNINLSYMTVKLERQCDRFIIMQVKWVTTVNLYIIT